MKLKHYNIIRQPKIKKGLLTGNIQKLQYYIKNNSQKTRFERSE